jgi:hypothetical protein
MEIWVVHPSFLFFFGGEVGERGLYVNCSPKKIEKNSTQQQQRKGEIEKHVHMCHTINKQTHGLPSKRKMLMRSLWRKGQQQRRNWHSC